MMYLQILKSSRQNIQPSTVSNRKKGYPPRSLCCCLFTFHLYSVLNVFSVCGDFMHVSKIYRTSSPRLFDCKSQFVMLYIFFIISCDLQLRAAFMIYLFSLSKSRDDAQSFFATLFHPFLAFSSLQHQVQTPSQEGLWSTEGSCGGVSIITRIANQTRNVLMRENIS